MKWNREDVAIYLKAKEYIDTVLIPLIPISFHEEDMKETMELVEMTNYIALQIERQYKGRILLLPGYTYMKHQDNKNQLMNLKNWETTILNEGFKHIIYVSLDEDWSLIDGDILGKFLSPPKWERGEEKSDPQAYYQENFPAFVDQLKSIWKK